MALREFRVSIHSREQTPGCKMPRDQCTDMGSRETRIYSISHLQRQREEKGACEIVF